MPGVRKSEDGKCAYDQDAETDAIALEDLGVRLKLT